MSTRFWAQSILKFLESKVLKYDLVASNFVYQFRNSLLTKAMIFISYFGQEVPIVLSFVISFVLAYDGYVRESLYFLSTVFIAILVNTILKLSVVRVRPSLSPIKLLKTYSFPSGHSITAFVFYIMTWFLVFRFTGDNNLVFNLLPAVAVIIFLVGLSRVYLGVHYVSDVLAGFFLGFLILFVLSPLIRIFFV